MKKLMAISMVVAAIAFSATALSAQAAAPAAKQAAPATKPADVKKEEPKKDAGKMAPKDAMKKAEACPKGEKLKDPKKPMDAKTNPCEKAKK